MNPNSSKDFPNNPIPYFLLGASVAVQNASSIQNGSATDPAIRCIFFWLADFAANQKKDAAPITGAKRYNKKPPGFRHLL